MSSLTHLAIEMIERGLARDAESLACALGVMRGTAEALLEDLRRDGRLVAIDAP